MTSRTGPIDASEDEAVNPRCHLGVATIGQVVAQRLTRRGMMKTSAGMGTLLATEACASAPNAARSTADVTFVEIRRGSDHTHHIPVGYEAQVLVRWGDPLFADSPAFDPVNQSAAAQTRQFGYNNDFIGYVPLPPERGFDERALLCVNHEYTSTRLMFPGVRAGNGPEITAAMCETEVAAHGGSILEVVRRGGAWAVRADSRFNRRITGTTPMRVSGPAAGADRLKTSADPSGARVLGTLNNCAGGVTPWKTYLMAEENFNGNFSGVLPPNHREARNHARYGVPGGWYAWGAHIPRFDVGAEPNEPNRFGWVVEVDPKDPLSTPVKRTALGRLKHEGAESVVAPDGRVVLYMGDDQRFDYAYKFVTSRPWRPGDDAWNRDLLDEGVLYAGRFDADGSVTWLPLVFGEGPLTPTNGFHSQADVLIETRRAADLVEATPMDRPEDFEASPKTGRAYLILTNNTERKPDRIDAANPRANNIAGHIIEIIEPDGDFAATRSRWEILVRCGDPSDPTTGAAWNPATTQDGWFGSPDNCAVDPSGRLWVATDGNEATGAADGLWSLGVSGHARGEGRAFFRAPVGAEVCGPRFSPEGCTLFVAVQHPGDGDDASFENPTTRWPDFAANRPPRPAVLAIRRKDGGPIGA
jgi:secreted PhoX family phosphatase